MVKNVSEAIDVNKAVDLGLEACKICKPATVSSQPIISNKPQGEGKKYHAMLWLYKGWFPLQAYDKRC